MSMDGICMCGSHVAWRRCVMEWGCFAGDTVYSVFKAHLTSMATNDI